MSDPVAPPPADKTDPHDWNLEPAGSYYGWSCLCGKSSRGLLPQYRAIRNAKAHAAKARREERERTSCEQSCPDVATHLAQTGDKP